jgi:ferredoxin
VNASDGPRADADPTRGIPARVVVASGTTLSLVKLSLVVDACHGHQMCAIAAPELFGSDEFGNAVLLVDGDVPAHLEAKARRAEANCPERAIVVTE